MRPRLSFRLKTILGIALIQALALVALIWTGQRLMQATSEEQFLQRAAAATGLFATTTKDGVLATDVATLDALAEEMLRNPDVMYARVRDRRGRVLAQRGDVELLQRNFAVDHQLQQVRDGIFDTSAAVHEGGVDHGRVEIGFSTVPLQHVFAEFTGRLGLIAVFGLALAALFSFVLGTYLTRQFVALREGVRHLAEGDVGYQLPVHGHDELAATVSVFNNMSQRLADALLQQRQTQEHLEQRVVERTRELQKSKERLEAEIAERKQAETVLAERSQQLARSNAEAQQFAYVASHDLQEPLRMVSSYLQLLEQRYQDKLDADAREFIGYAVDGAKRMHVLINDLLTYSRIGTSGEKFEPIDCEAVLQTVLRNLHAAIDESGAHIAHDPLPTIMGDATQLTQLLQNLIGNAIKFRREQALEIRIRAQLNGRSWRFSVQDNGIGIAPEYFERIFGLFQRLHSRVAYTGTGIGLAVCKKVVERHRGCLWVESTVGSGSTFCFTIPQQGV